MESEGYIRFRWRYFLSEYRAKVSRSWISMSWENDGRRWNCDNDKGLEGHGACEGGRGQVFTVTDVFSKLYCFFYFCVIFEALVLYEPWRVCIKI